MFYILKYKTNYLTISYQSSLIYMKRIYEARIYKAYLYLSYGNKLNNKNLGLKMVP